MPRSTPQQTAAIKRKDTACRQSAGTSATSRAPSFLQGICHGIGNAVGNALGRAAVSATGAGLSFLAYRYSLPKRVAYLVYPRDKVDRLVIRSQTAVTVLLGAVTLLCVSAFSYDVFKLAALFLSRRQKRINNCKDNYCPSTSSSTTTVEPKVIKPSPNDPIHPEAAIIADERTPGFIAAPVSDHSASHSVGSTHVNSTHSTSHNTAHVNSHTTSRNDHSTNVPGPSPTSVHVYSPSDGPTMAQVAAGAGPIAHAPERSNHSATIHIPSLTAYHPDPASKTNTTTVTSTTGVTNSTVDPVSSDETVVLSADEILESIKANDFDAALHPDHDVTEQPAKVLRIVHDESSNNSRGRDKKDKKKKNKSKRSTSGSSVSGNEMSDA